MPRKILIIDDDPRNIFALKATLLSKGFQCATATSALQGLAFLTEQPDIEIVLLDMMMPDMDGYEAIPKIKEKQDIPVVAVTAQAMVGDREKCIKAGADEYISKPIDVDKLLTILTNHIN